MIGGGILRRLRNLPAALAEEQFERDVLKRFRGEFAPQVFILGLPRSGTTLVYQYIVHRYHVSYFTNGVGQRPYDPCRTTYRQMRANPPYASDFESAYGRSQGEMAPREAGNFWLRFFDIDAYESADDLRAHRAAALARSIHTMQALSGGAPFVNKNVKHMLRIDALASVFPDARFLVVERDMVDVALSVMRSRVKTLGDRGAWFSVKPPEYDEIRLLAPEEQVCAQVFALEARLNDDLRRVKADRVHTIAYEDFCAHPDSVFDSMADIFENVDEKNAPVAHFALRHSLPEDEVEEKLVAYVRNRLES